MKNPQNKLNVPSALLSVSLQPKISGQIVIVTNENQNAADERKVVVAKVWPFLNHDYNK